MNTEGLSRRSLDPFITFSRSKKQKNVSKCPQKEKSDFLAKPEDVQRSRFVECPLCKEMVLIFRINDHIEFECLSESTHSEKEVSTHTTFPREKRKTLKRLRKLNDPANTKRQKKLQTYQPKQEEGTSYFNNQEILQTEDVQVKNQQQLLQIGKVTDNDTRQSAVIVDSSKPSEPSVHTLNQFSPAPTSQNRRKGPYVPLAEVVRPTSLEQFLGQQNVVGEDSVIGELLSSSSKNHNKPLPSMIFWGIIPMLKYEFHSVVHMFVPCRSTRCGQNHFGTYH